MTKNDEFLFVGATFPTDLPKALLDKVQHGEAENAIPYLLQMYTDSTVER